MDAPPGLRHRHPLDTMGTAFVFQLTISSLSCHHEGNFLEAADFRGIAVQYLRTPALLFRIASVHAEKVAGKEGRLLAPYATANLHDDILIVIGVLGQQENGQFLLQLLFSLAVLRNLCLQQMLHLRVIFFPQHFLVLSQPLAYLFILTVSFYNRGQLGVLLGVALPFRHILHGIRVTDQGFQFQIFIFYCL